MSEWMIPCRSCGYDNIASTEYDLEKMIGPYNPEINIGGLDKKTGKVVPRVPGLVCARCSKTDRGLRGLKHIFPEDGHWLISVQSDEKTS